MTKFRLHDPVRITAPYSRHFDAVGTVTNVDPAAHFPFRVSGLEVTPVWFGAHELVLAEHAPTEEPS
jgi:hypothetical protein